MISGFSIWHWLALVFVPMNISVNNLPHFLKASGSSGTKMTLFNWSGFGFNEITILPEFFFGSISFVNVSYPMLDAISLNLSEGILRSVKKPFSLVVVPIEVLFK